MSESNGNKLNTPSKEKSVSKDTSDNLNAKPNKIDSNKISKTIQSGSSNINNIKKPSDSSNLKNGSIKNLLEKANSTINNINKQANNINISRNNDKTFKDQKVNFIIDYLKLYHYIDFTINILDPGKKKKTFSNT